MTGLADLRKGTPGHWVQNPQPTAPTVPEASPVQTALPTSAYGQTIPVVWGKCRLPGAYIWVPPIVTVTETHMEWWDQITTTTTSMSCRLRFARPLVPDSTWTMRKLYSNGTLIYDASQGYRAKGLKFRAYDGRSTQPRDPTMTSEEGTNNVSAHRGYLDIVLTDFDIQGFGAPPVFEAEWIQDGATNHDYDNFTTITSGVANFIIPVWQDGMFYVYTEADGLVRYFSIGAMQEYFYVSQADFSFLFAGWRYSRNLNRLMYLGQDGGGAWSFYLNDPVSGIVDVGDTVGTIVAVMGTVALVEFPNTAVYLGFTNAEQFFAYYVEQNTASLAFESATSWEGYTNFECLTVGEVRGSDFDVYLCADADLVKITFASTGALKAFSVVATLSDDLRYAVYDGGAVVVWTDAATVVRLNGTTGAIEFTKSVPYQIQTYTSRVLGDPDLQRLTNELYFVASSTSYYTDLSTGETRSVSGATSNPNLFYYDGQNDIVITETGLGVPQRLRIIAGDGTQRALSDFLTDLMVYGGGFETSDISVEGVDDVVDGAVVDITAGARDIARATCEPYSIAIFERSGQIIFKRASTDLSFAVDQSIASTGDIVDQ